MWSKTKLVQHTFALVRDVVLLVAARVRAGGVVGRGHTDQVVMVGSKGPQCQGRGRRRQNVGDHEPGLDRLGLARGQGGAVPHPGGVGVHQRTAGGGDRVVGVIVAFFGGWHDGNCGSFYGHPLYLVWLNRVLSACVRPFRREAFGKLTNHWLVVSGRAGAGARNTPGVGPEGEGSRHRIILLQRNQCTHRGGGIPASRLNQAGEKESCSLYLCQGSLFAFPPPPLSTQLN